MASKQHHSDLSRKTIINQAATLFAEKGYAGTSLNEICARSQMSKGNVYHHFQNKEMIYFAVLEDYINRFSASVQARLTDTMTAEQQLQIFADLFEQEAASPLLHTVGEFAACIGDTPATLAKIQALFAQIIELLAAIVSSGIVRGELKNTDATEVAFSLYALLIGVSQISYAFATPPKDKYMTALHHLIWGLRQG